MLKSLTGKKVYITAGSAYLDIDAYACMIAMAELLQLQGINAIAYSAAAHNYSVCPSLVKSGQIFSDLPAGDGAEEAYIIVDASDPAYLKQSVPIEKVVAVYDHHAGFEEYWARRIGQNAKIEFIGAAATLIYRAWKKAELQDKLSRDTARLLIAAILDNTLNLTSANTTDEDVEVFEELCRKAEVGADWCASYFLEVQEGVEADLHNALINDTKAIGDNKFLPSRMSQLCVWDADCIIEKLPEIRGWFAGAWMLNIIDVQRKCSYFVCDDCYYQEKIGRLFDVTFENGVAKTSVSYLRKEIIKKTLSN